MDLKFFAQVAAIAALVVWASNNVTAVRRVIGR